MVPPQAKEVNGSHRDISSRSENSGKAKSDEQALGAAVLVGSYMLIAVVFAVYGAIWGDFSFKGVFWNIGRGLIWPITVFEFAIDLVWTAIKYVLGFLAVIFMLWFIGMARRR